MKTLYSILKNEHAKDIEKVIGQKRDHPFFPTLKDPQIALHFAQKNICASYLFARYTMPHYASHVFASLAELPVVDSTLGPILKGVAQSIQGELYNNNIFQKIGVCHSHYHDMLKAYEHAGGEMGPVEEFITHVESYGFRRAIEMSQLWSEGSVRYANTTLEICEDKLATFIMVPATEQITPLTFQQALTYLPQDSCFDPFRTFMKRHVEIDQGDHGPSTLNWLDYYINYTRPSPRRVEQATQRIAHLLGGIKK